MTLQSITDIPTGFSKPIGESLPVAVQLIVERLNPEKVILFGLYPRLFPVDILAKTPEEIDSALKQGDFFIKELLSKGHVLYERRK